MTTYYVPADQTAAEWTASARECRVSAGDSFDRCDTDGFLSQWASQSTARMYDRLAELAANGGTDEISWVFTANGEMVDEFEQVEGRYGWSIKIRHNGRTVFWNESEAKKGARRLAADQKKGYVWGVVRTAIVCRFGGSSTALSVIDVPAAGAAREIVTVLDSAAYADRLDRTESETSAEYSARCADARAAAAAAISAA